MENDNTYTLFSDIVEEQITSLQKEDLNTELRDILEDLLRFVQKYHFTLWLVPKSLITPFQKNNHLRIFYDKIRSKSMHHTRVIFYEEGRIENDCISALELGSGDFKNISQSSSLRNTIGLMKDNIHPIIFDFKNRIMTKDECTLCNEKAKNCYNSCSINLYRDVTMDLLKDNAKTNLNKIKTIKSSNISEDILKFTASLQGILRGCSIDDLNKTSEYKVIKKFFADLQHVRDFDIINTGYSMFRCMFASRLDRNNVVQESIDWHTAEKTKKYRECEAYKGDVCRPDQTGYGGQIGTHRLLFTKHEGKKYFLAYTEDHSFSQRKFEQRIDLMLAEKQS